MPPFEKMDRKQDAVLWPNAGYSDQAQVLRGTPVQLKVRWVKKKTYMISPEGDKVPIDVQVVVDREIKVGSFMWYGLLTAYNRTGSTGTDPEIMQVVANDVTPDLKNRVNRYTVGLAFFRQAKPPDDPSPPGDE